MITRVYLMRHGEVANGGEKRYNGHIDVDITQKGVQQMHRLAGLLTGRPVSAVYSSDLIRSAKGGPIIADSPGPVHGSPLGTGLTARLRGRILGPSPMLLAEHLVNWCTTARAAVFLSSATPTTAVPRTSV